VEERMSNLDSRKRGDLQYGGVQRRNNSIGKTCTVGSDDDRSGGEYVQLRRCGPTAVEVDHVETWKVLHKSLSDLVEAKTAKKI